MPYYELECKNCGHNEEKFLSFKQHNQEKENPPKCPECSCLMQFAVPTGTNFSLKGGGWAKDGYSKENK